MLIAEMSKVWKKTVTVLAANGPFSVAGRTILQQSPNKTSTGQIQ